MTIAGKVWKFDDNVNTDLMVPGFVLYATEAEQARAVFSANRPSWVDEVQPGDVIVGGQNFGMGSSRPAARSLKNCGVSVLLAETINGLFFRNAVNFGFLAIECPGVHAAFDEGDRAEVDLESWTVRNPRSGLQLRAKPIPQALLSLMLEGGIYPHLEKRGLIGGRASDPAARQ